MNQRIRQLAEQCRFEIQGINCEVLGQGFDEEKFAELIVVECAMFVVAELEGKVGSAIADATANRLEEHFGVEE